jgi:hypothetical protein
MNSTTPPAEPMITDHTGEPPSWPARPGHIPPRLWLAAVDHVRQHAQSTPVFADLWRVVHRKHLYRVVDGSRSDVFYSLFTIYQLAGGPGSTYDSAPDVAIAGPPRAAETAARLSAFPGRLEPERR